MQNKYVINFSKKFWFWFWTKLMNGFAPSDLQGNYRRPRGILINKNYKKESIIDSGEDSIIDRLDLIPEEFDVENQNDDVSVPVE